MKRRDITEPEYADARFLQIARDAMQHDGLPCPGLARKDQQPTMRLRSSKKFGARSFVNWTPVKDLPVYGVSERVLSGGPRAMTHR